MKSKYIFAAIVLSSSMSFAKETCEYKYKSGVAALDYVLNLFTPKVCKKSDVPLPCDGLQDGQMVACLENQKALDFSLKQDKWLKKQLDADDRLQNTFKEDPSYKDLLAEISVKNLMAGDAGVSEGYSIGQHTTYALLIYESQKQQYKINEQHTPSFVKNKDLFMRYTIAYHDIGKSIAVRTGDKTREVVYSYPIAWRLMKHSDFTDDESRFTIALIHQHQTIGYYLTGQMSLEEATAQIKHMADFSHTSVQDFFYYLEVLYVADAGSYPYLKDKVFEQTPEGKMVPRSPQYQILKSSVLGN
jgi:hypothetical protein